MMLLCRMTLGSLIAVVFTMVSGGCTSTVAASFADWQLAASSVSSRPTASATVTPQDMPSPECDPSEAPRITRFAGGAFEELGSTSQGVRAAKADRLLLNGEVANMNRRVQPGDLVELLPAAEQTVAIDEERQIRFAEGLLKSGTLEVVYEDDVMAVVNKPAGVHSKPYGGPLSLEHALPGLLAPPQEATDALVRPTCVHRLDARVSGLIVVAKTRHAAAHLAEAFRERRVSKRYRALLLGRLQPEELLAAEPPLSLPGGLTLEAVPAEQAADTGGGDAAVEGVELQIRSMMDGKPAFTSLTVVEHTPHVQAGWMTTVDLKPHTGRRHQLRRHCLELGYPMCGDDLYALDGNAFAGKRSTGLFLQSVEVEVPHPSDDSRSVHLTLPEAAKFRRQRERAQLGWAYVNAAREPAQNTGR